MAITVESVSTTLLDVVHRYAAGDLRPAPDAVRELSRPGPLGELVHQVMDHPQEPARCAPMSYFHTLGFEKYTLINRKPDFMLRLHIWHPDPRRSPGHIHNHRSAVASSIISGLLSKQIFERDPVQPSLAEYHEETTDGAWHLREIGRTGLRQTELTLLEPGARYTLAAETLHQVEVADDKVTATLFLEMRATRTTTNVFVPAGGAVPKSIPKLPLTPTVYRQRLKGAFAALGL